MPSSIISHFWPTPSSMSTPSTNPVKRTTALRTICTTTSNPTSARDTTSANARLQLDGCPATAFDAILASTGRAAHLDAVRTLLSPPPRGTSLTSFFQGQVPQGHNLPKTLG